jgi:hypothetical protein
VSERSSARDGDDARGLVAGTLRGYRTWHLLPRCVDLTPGSLPLASVTRPHVTWPPELSASCTPADAGFGRSTGPPVVPDHPAPSSDCTCGIYAWYAPADARTLSAEVFGAVEASGVVLMGTHGFRAERARITAIATRSRRLSAACAEVGIPVYRRRRDLVAAHPPDDVSTLLGESPPVRSRRPPAFALVVCVSVWLRALLLVVAAGVLPLGAILATVVLSEAAVLALVLVYVRTRPERRGRGGTAPAAGAPPPDP